MDDQLISDLVKVTKSVLRLEEASELSSETDLWTFGLDSLAVLELMLEIQERFGVNLVDVNAGLFPFSTVQEIAAVVRSQRSAAIAT